MHVVVVYLNMLFAVTDIETTGAFAAGNSITEIAVVLTDGVNVVDSYSTFVKPEKPIPPFITHLTGITNEMVEHAPVFADIVDDLESFTSEAVFVAHNVGFDYSFIKKHFEMLDLRFNRNKLCTVRLARAISPGLTSYSLANLCRHFDIQNTAPHRAMGDTMATVELFHLLVKMDKEGHIAKTLKKGSGEQWLPPHLLAETFQSLPEKPGVYYLRDSKGKPLYIGMSINIKKRIRQHFGGTMKSNRRQEFLKSVVDIDFTLCGSELVALLLEDQEIRKHWPPFNRAQKAPVLRHAVMRYSDQLGYQRLGIQSAKNASGIIKKFHSAQKARNWLQKLASEYELHPALCNLPVLTKEDLPKVKAHNDTLSKALAELDSETESAAIVGPGRTWEEYSVVWVENGQYKGYGFVDAHVLIQSKNDIELIIDLAHSSITTDAIVRSFLEKSAVLKEYKTILIE
jgi:DNA polymerase III subunit epsilon